MAFTSTSAYPRIAIIGGGISGLAAAFALKDTADVTLFEKRDRLGGHACTKTIDYLGVTIDVDIGFIVCNALNYRNFLPFMRHLSVELVDSDMSFSVSDPNGFEWSSDPTGLFAWKRNFLNVRYLNMLREILRFNKASRQCVADDQLPKGSLADYLDEMGVSQTFKDNYILPMGAAIWSTPEKDMMDYPAASFLAFFDNHRLMHVERPVWKTVKGGSKTYVNKLAALLEDRVILGKEVTSVSKTPQGHPRLSFENGEEQDFDEVIFAGHSDQTRRILGPDYAQQRQALNDIKYGPNTVYLHRDESLMPSRKTAWASWNVLRHSTDRVCVSYWMNRLQSISMDHPLFVTLNPETPPSSDKVFIETSFDHPLFDSAALKSRKLVEALQGQQGLWFSGAWMGDGFHEAGLRSGLAVAFALGGRVPWNAFGVPKFTSKHSDAPPASLSAAGEIS